MPRRLVLQLFVTCASVGVIVMAVGSAQQPPPQFRSGVDLTRVEVTVLDKQTRKPIVGLTPDDFVVRVGGDIQRIATLAEVTVPGPPEAPSASFTEAAHDVSGNDGPRPRLFLIVMNDADGAADPFDRQIGKQIAHRLIDGLGSEDKAAIVFTRDNRDAQDFSADRTLLRRAVERFNPMHTVGIDRFKVLARAQQFLADLPGYRRALIFISPLPKASPSVNYFGVDEEAEAFGRSLRQISSSARVSHVPVYIFGTHGLHAPTAEDMNPKFAGSDLGRNRDDASFLEFARTVANQTGGRAIVANNSPAGLVPALFEELASYYALAYESTHPHDGRARWLEIEVKHPGAIAMPSRVLVATAKPLKEFADAVLNPRRESGLFEALGAALPAGDLPLRLSNVALPVTGRREQAVVLTLGLPPVLRGVSEVFRVRLLLFDGEGRRQLRDEARDISMTGSDLTVDGTEVALRLDLRPGRYQLRVGTDRTSTRTAGSVHATLLVPDFAQEALSLSGVAVGRVGGPPLVGREALADLLPFAPTADREFSSSDKVGARLTIHQGTRRAARAVELETEIIDAAGAVVHGVLRTVAPGAFDKGSVEHRLELPLRALMPGDYLLRFAASSTDARAQRDVRFTVLPR